MTTFAIYRPKGEALGFQVTADIRDQMIDAFDLINELGFKLTMFEVRPQNTAVVTYINDLDGFAQTLNLIPGYTVHQENGLPVTMSTQSWESKDMYFDDEGNMYEAAEELSALRLSGSDSDKLRQALEWADEIGCHLGAYGMREDGSNWLLIDGVESEDIGHSDYVIFNEGRIEVHTKESLSGEGYTFQDEI